MIIYGAAPFVVTAVSGCETNAPIRSDRSRESRSSPRESGWPPVRWPQALGATALALLLWPSLAVDHGPWALTPATTRALAGYVAQVAFGALLVSREERWGSWRILLQAFLVATALLLVGVARAWDEIETGRVAAWIFLVGLVGWSRDPRASGGWKVLRVSSGASALRSLTRTGSRSNEDGRRRASQLGSHQLRSPSSVIVAGHEDEPHERRVERDGDRPAERDRPGSPGSPSR